MKSTTTLLLAALLIPWVPQVDAATVIFDNDNADNDWAGAANWSTDSVPTTSTDANVVALVNNGNVADVSSAVPDVSFVRLGNNASGGTISIQSGGSLVATSATQVATANGSVGTLNIAGGSLSAGSLQVAANQATAADGFVHITAGDLTWTQGFVGTQGTGAIGVTGSDATSITGLNLTLGDGGGLEFVLGSAGVTKMTITNTLTIGNLSTLVVNLAAYASGAATIDLVDAGQPLATTFASGNISIQDTPSGYTASVIQDGANGLVQVQIAAVPEPDAAALLGGVGILFLFRRARRQDRR